MERSAVREESFDVPGFVRAGRPDDATSKVSVIICTHNPRKEYLTEVLQALFAQTLPSRLWEVVVVDNASSDPVDVIVPSGWNGRWRIVREEALGLTRARVKGIAETTGELLVFVDDDNVLASNYLEEALKIANDRRFLGAWGGGVVGRFEASPSREAAEHLGMLGIRPVPRVEWSNAIGAIRQSPTGVGLCVRRVVAERYRSALAEESGRCRLDRRGGDLTSCGDTDLAWTATDVGQGFGVFPQLQAVHLIPASRLAPPYLIRLAEGLAYSGAILMWLRVGLMPSRRRWWRRLLRDASESVLGGLTRRIDLAARRGAARALAEIDAGRWPRSEAGDQ